MNLSDKLAAERRARLAAERMLDLKSRELFEANAKLSRHAMRLSDQIVEQRAEFRVVRDEAEQLKGQTLQARARLQEAERQVIAVERRLWDSVESITDGFAVFDAEDRLIAANSAWLSIFDAAGRIGPGTPYRDVMQLAAQDGIVDIGEATPLSWSRQMHHRWRMTPVPEVVLRLSGDRHCRLVDRRARDGDMVCLTQDITALKRHEAELQEARRSAEAAVRAKSAFLANMSHELRTPMNGVVAMAELLLESDLDEEQQLYLRTIRSSGEALLAIINDVLDLSKMEAQRLVLHPEPFDLERLVHEVVLLVGPTVGDKALGMHVDYDLFLPNQLLGDAGRIRQILTNLVGNAVKFTYEGHVLIRVAGMEVDGGAWAIHVTVEDTGIGIDPEMVDHVFASFAQVEDERNREFEGTGLGLAICRQLVELMDGEMWVESEKGSGSCFGFRITLPCVEPSGELPLVQYDGRLSVLVVGGADLDRAILERQLGQLGFETDFAASGADALTRLAERGPPSVVMVDSDLPDGRGENFAHALRSAGLEADIVLICPEGRTSSLICRNEIPADRILSRPIVRRNLLRTIANLSVAIPTSGQKVVPLPARDASPTAPTGPRRMKVLAAEDNKTNRFVFAKMVKSLNIDLEFARNGDEAVEVFQTYLPDLIFMDISMPGTDGKEATRRIRHLEAGRSHTPIIAVTAHAMTGDEEEILSAGLDHYMTKPLRKQEILDAVERYCPAGCLSPCEQEERRAHSAEV